MNSNFNSTVRSICGITLFSKVGLHFFAIALLNCKKEVEKTFLLIRAGETYFRVRSIIYLAA